MGNKLRSGPSPVCGPGSGPGSPQCCRLPRAQCLPSRPQADPPRPPPSSLCCIAPVLAARVLRGVEVTVGHEQEEGGRWPYAGTVEAIKALGARHCVKDVTISFWGAGRALRVTCVRICKTDAAAPGCHGAPCGSLLPWALLVEVPSCRFLLRACRSHARC